MKEVNKRYIGSSGWTHWPLFFSMPFADPGKLRRQLLQALNDWPTSPAPTAAELAASLRESELDVDNELVVLIRDGLVYTHHVLNRTVRLSITREGRETLELLGDS